MPDRRYSILTGGAQPRARPRSTLPPVKAGESIEDYKARIEAKMREDIAAEVGLRTELQRKLEATEAALRTHQETYRVNLEETATAKAQAASAIAEAERHRAAAVEAENRVNALREDFGRTASTLESMRTEMPRQDALLKAFAEHGNRNSLLTIERAPTPTPPPAPAEPKPVTWKVDVLHHNDEIRQLVLTPQQDQGATP